MSMLELTDLEKTRAELFKEWIRSEFGKRMYEKARFVYIVSESNGVGQTIKICEETTGEERNITDYNAW